MDADVKDKIYHFGNLPKCSGSPIVPALIILFPPCIVIYCCLVAFVTSCIALIDSL